MRRRLRKKLGVGEFGAESLVGSFAEVARTARELGRGLSSLGCELWKLNVAWPRTHGIPHD